ncbi:MAG: ribosomal RNA small subunit methyltransferase A [Clostridia bacterium]|nr:ribosomal RNA small subunit methyltransferase A [Clostridia bacterium]
MGYDLTNPRAVRELLDEFSLSPKKGYGQNFLINPDVPYRIAAAAASGRDVGYERAQDVSGAAALEIGPGVGAMTVCLSDLFDKVVAVEIDSSLIPLLDKTLAECENVKVVNSDFLKTDLPELIAEEFSGMRVRVCANLPYYVTTPVLMKLLESFPPYKSPAIESITVMVQTEVANRMCDAAGGAEYGALTASIALHGEAKKLFSVSPGNFYPAPKVSSSVVQITLYENGIYDLYHDAPVDKDDCFRFIESVKELISLSFAQRRKTLTNALSGKFPKERTASALETMGMKPDIRGERLSAADFCRLSSILYDN